MAGVNCLVFTLMLATGPASAEVEAAGVRIQVEVHAGLYTYEVLNLASDPIRSFEINFAQAYNFKSPEGWECEEDGDTFRAWSPRAGDAIHRGEKGQFSLRMNSRGAVLGQADVRLETLSGAPVVVDNVWGAVPEPRAHIVLVGGVVGVIVAFHGLLLARRKSRNGRATTCA